MKIKDASEKKAIFMINVSNELKVSEIKFHSKASTRTIALSLKFTLIILTHKIFFPSGLKERGQAQATLLFSLY